MLLLALASINIDALLLQEWDRFCEMIYGVRGNSPTTFNVGDGEAEGSKYLNLLLYLLINMLDKFNIDYGYFLFRLLLYLAIGY